MSYKEFDLGSALKILKIRYIIHAEEPEVYKQLTQEFTSETKFTPSQIFWEDFGFGLTEYQTTFVFSEAMVRIELIRPFLWEVWKHHRNLRIWHGIDLNADPEQRLTGTPDYLVTKRTGTPDAPYFVIMEAKPDENFKKDCGQTLAAMRGAQILNRRHTGIHISIYGALTTGIFWSFGKLADDHFITYPETLFINASEPENPVKILSILDIIFAECEKNIA